MDGDAKARAPDGLAYPRAEPLTRPARPRRGLVGRVLLLLLLAAATAGAWWWWQGGPGGGPAPAPRAGPPPIPVTVAEVARRDVALRLDALGTVQPLESVVVRAQLDGQLLEVLFREGEEVSAGQVLARVDDRAPRAALDQALARGAYARAQLANARLDLQRYEGLVRGGGATRQQADTQRAQVAMLEAQLRQEEAASEAGRTQLGFATVSSPIAGRAGIRRVDAGNLVRPSDPEGLVTVTRMDPISVAFALPQQELPRLLRAMAAGPVPVETRPAPSDRAPLPTLLGRVTAVDNAVEPTTGTVRVRAEFENPERLLWPGAFVNLSLRIEVVPEAVVVPLVSVQRGPRGPYAFVLGGGDRLEQRPVETGPASGGEAVILSGLRPGERVVTSGGLRLSQGTAVSVVEEGGPPAPLPVPPPRRRRAEASR